MARLRSVGAVLTLHVLLSGVCYVSTVVSLQQVGHRTSLVGILHIKTTNSFCSVFLCVLFDPTNVDANTLRTSIEVKFCVPVSLPKLLDFELSRFVSDVERCPIKETDKKRHLKYCTWQ